MARSMTGFGQARTQINGVQYVVEIRSVNSRYFKASIRLPEVWSFLESDIDQVLRQRLHRGSIHFCLRMRSDSAETAYQVNVAAMERYIEQLETIRPDQADIELALDMASLLQLPGVCTPPESDELLETAAPELMKLIGQALDALTGMRAVEGRVIAKDLLAHCEVIERHAGEIAHRAGDIVKAYHQRLKRRVEELTAAANLKIDQQDLAREVAVFAERCDIAEELSRLTGHVQQFRAALEKEEQAGRKLDFIAQEMLREANTIAAKAGDGLTARNVVEIKTAVDRIKEQVQNVE
ncbi:MAG: hypothetical protein AMJ81_14540 [Phycisphaerae bacterium SM23_33]|nr:MAG: hypothetical protein AMJ81_14540 [Phycisphaerae bacterium SM23_33]